MNLVAVYLRCIQIILMFLSSGMLNMKLLIEIVLFLYLINGAKCKRAWDCSWARVPEMRELERLEADFICGNSNALSTIGNLSIDVKFTPLYFDITEEDEFIRVVGIMDMSWTREHLKWDPRSYGGIAKFSPNPSDIWQPTFTMSFPTYYGPVNIWNLRELKDPVIHSNGLVTQSSVAKLFGPCHRDYQLRAVDKWKCEFILIKTSDFKNNFKVKFEDEDLNSTALWANNLWEIDSNPIFEMEKETDSTIKLFIIVQKRTSHHTLLIALGFVLVTLSLTSLLLTDQMYCRLTVNVWTALLQAILLIYTGWILGMDDPNDAVALSEFYVAALVTSFIGILLAASSASLDQKTSETPKFIIDTIHLIKSSPYIAFFVLENTYKGFGDAKIEGTIDEKPVGNNSDWKIIKNVVDRSIFVLIVVYFFIFHLSS